MELSLSSMARRHCTCGMQTWYSEEKEANAQPPAGVVGYILNYLGILE